MTTRVEQIAEQVKALPEKEMEEFLAWLVDYEVDQNGTWDQELAKDSQSGGRLSKVLDRVKSDISAGRTKPLNELLDNT